MKKISCELAEEIIETEDHYAKCPHCHSEQVIYCTIKSAQIEHNARRVGHEQFHKMCETCNKLFIALIPKYKELL